LALECVNFGGKCFALWRRIPFVVGGKCLGVRVNVFGCVGKCRLLWRQMPLCVEAIAFELLSLVWLYACANMDVCVRVYMGIVVGAYVSLC